MSHLNTYFLAFCLKILGGGRDLWMVLLSSMHSGWVVGHSNSTYCNLIDLNFLQMLKNLACTCAHPTSHLVKVSLPNIYYHSLCPPPPTDIRPGGPPPASDIWCWSLETCSLEDYRPHLLTSSGGHRNTYGCQAGASYWNAVLFTARKRSLGKVIFSEVCSFMAGSLFLVHVPSRDLCLSDRDPLPLYKSGWYASYWNAFIFLITALKRSSQGGGGFPACNPGLQAHNQVGGSWGVWLGGLQAHTRGGSPGPHPGGVPACTEADTPRPPSRWLLLRAVRILLECILVQFIFLQFQNTRAIYRNLQLVLRCL